MTPITVEKIDSLAGLEKLRQSWNELLESCREATVFDSWEWQIHAARSFATDGKLAVLAAYSGDALVAVLPLCESSKKIGHLFSATVYRCLGGAITDYNSVIAGERFFSESLSAFARYLAENGCIVDLENAFPHGPLDVLGGQLLKHRFRAAVYESKIALVADLAGGYERYLKSRKKKFLKTMRNNRNYMDKTGGYSYLKEEADGDLLAALIRLHTSRWEHKGESGVLARERIKDFHNALLRADDRPFEIKYYTIRHQDKIIAILYGFLFRERFYAYLSGLDMAHNRISPGNMIIDFCIRDLCETGVGLFDMLRGDMQYKQTWATISYDMIDRLYFPPTLSGRLLYRFLKIVQGVKRLVPASIKKRAKAIIKRDTAGDGPND